MFFCLDLFGFEGFMHTKKLTCIDVVGRKNPAHDSWEISQNLAAMSLSVGFAHLAVSQIFRVTSFVPGWSSENLGENYREKGDGQLPSDVGIKISHDNDSY